jgi:hypothetical protein
LPTCLGSRSTQVRILPLRRWVAIWDRAGLQNRPARFNPSAARNEPRVGERELCSREPVAGGFRNPPRVPVLTGECPSRWGTGPENQGDLLVRGSIPPLSSNTVETRCLSVRHTGPLRRRAHALREFDSLRLLRVRRSWVSGGEPIPRPLALFLCENPSGSHALPRRAPAGKARLRPRDCRGRQDGKATGCNPVHARVRFPPSTLMVFSRPRCSRLHAGSPGQRGGFDSRWALKTHAWPIGMRHRPSKPARRVRFPPRAHCSFAGRVLAPKPAS